MQKEQKERYSNQDHGLWHELCTLFEGESSLTKNQYNRLHRLHSKLLDELLFQQAVAPRFCYLNPPFPSLSTMPISQYQLEAKSLLSLIWSMLKGKEYYAIVPYMNIVVGFCLLGKLHLCTLNFTLIINLTSSFEKYSAILSHLKKKIRLDTLTSLQLK